MDLTKVKIKIYFDEIYILTENKLPLTSEKWLQLLDLMEMQDQVDGENPLVYTVLLRIRKVLQNWKNIGSKWVIKSYTELSNYLAQIPAFTEEMLLSSTVQQSIKAYIKSCLTAVKTTEEYTSLLQNTETTSTSSTIVIMEEDHVGKYNCAKNLYLRVLKIWHHYIYRCTWRTKFEIKENLLTAISTPCQTGSLRARDFRQILLYFSTCGRKLCYLQICGTKQRLLLQNINLEKEPSTTGCRSEERMEICRSSINVEFQEEQQNLQTLGKFKRGRDEVSRQNTAKRSGGKRIAIRLEELIWNNLTMPPEAVVHLDVYLNDININNIRENNGIFKDVLDMVKSKMCKYSIHDFYQHYTSEDSNPHWAAGPLPFYDYYYSVSETEMWIEKLLTFQCYNNAYIEYINNNWVVTERGHNANSLLEDDMKVDYLKKRTELVTEFLIKLYNVLEKKTPKKNTILVKGEINCGKNFFFDMILNYYINKGQLGNANKYNNFPFQDAPNRRIIFWDEPNYSSDSIEQLKNILGGDTCKVRVKFKEEGVVYRTPVIILTNNYLSIMGNSAFNPTRMDVLIWKPCSLLKEAQKKPNPLYTYHLFNKYNIFNMIK